MRKAHGELEIIKVLNLNRISNIHKIIYDLIQTGTRLEKTIEIILF